METKGKRSAALIPFFRNSRTRIRPLLPDELDLSAFFDAYQSAGHAAWIGAGDWFSDSFRSIVRMFARAGTRSALDIRVRLGVVLMDILSYGAGRGVRLAELLPEVEEFWAMSQLANADVREIQSWHLSSLGEVEASGGSWMKRLFLMPAGANLHTLAIRELDSFDSFYNAMRAHRTGTVSVSFHVESGIVHCRRGPYRDKDVVTCWLASSSSETTFDFLCRLIALRTRGWGRFPRDLDARIADVQRYFSTGQVRVSGKAVASSRWNGVSPMRYAGALSAATLGEDGIGSILLHTGDV